jgi:hypothetical protein
MRSRGECMDGVAVFAALAAVEKLLAQKVAPSEL